ncbi:MAG: hypothetical protein L6R41_007626 [Letrouitia leprolyta]|nr:MAG: hypothetical protein L6R41_007626 [Letrouitia leprolyta]
MHLEPWQSWAIVGLGAAGAYVYYSQTGNKRRSRGHATSVPKRRTSPRRGSSVDAGSGSGGGRRKSQSKKGENQVEATTAEAVSTSIPQSSNGKLKKRKGGKKESGQLAQSSAVNIAESQADETNNQEDGIDNREFAKQMNGLKAGSSFAKIEGSKKQMKAGKQAELPLNSFDALSPETNGTSISKDMSNASSTTGADADDDLSPAGSPYIAATPTAISGGVEDMLEPPAKGPSVLRLTGVEEAKRQPKPQKAMPEVETKKQRQNRRKNEEKKAAKEEAERERRVLLEKQLRTAREADGRPARNGVASIPAKSAWNKPNAGPTTNQQVPSTTQNEVLLDTFEDYAANTGNGRSDKPQGVAAADVQAWHNEVPSEEEQMRILDEMEGSGGWNTVAKGGKSKKKPAASDIENGRKLGTASATVTGLDDPNISTSDDGAPQLTPSQSQTDDEASQKKKTKKEDIDSKIWNHSNIKDHPDYDPAYPYALTGHPEDSDWAVV